jgi:pimeloyl-ACP methyl ester carboxylesterase
METVELSIRDTDLVASSAGSGPPLVFLHGHGYSRHSWSNVIERLGGSFRCLAPDQRGYGDSAGNPDATWDELATDVDAWVRLAGGRPILVGHSWGGKIALVTAATGAPIGGVYCVDGVATSHGGSLDEKLYERIAVPIAVEFATNEPRAYSADDVARWCARHPDIGVVTVANGHDIPGESPTDLAHRVAAFARRIG